MINCVVRSNETYDPAIHDEKYALKDDWISNPPVSMAKFNKKAGNKSGKNVQ